MRPSRPPGFLWEGLGVQEVPGQADGSILGARTVGNLQPQMRPFCTRAKTLLKVLTRLD